MTVCTRTFTVDFQNLQKCQQCLLQYTKVLYYKISYLVFKLFKFALCYGVSLGNYGNNIYLEGVHKNETLSNSIHKCTKETVNYVN